MKKKYGKTLKDMNGLYQVSNLGRVKSLVFWSNVHKKFYKREKIMKLGKNEQGYQTVVLCRNKVQTGKNIHRLVAEAFIENPYNLQEVNHKDENPSNNKVNNLEWCDHKYNINYGSRGRRIDQYDLENNFIQTWKNAGEASRNLNISENSIRYVCRHKLNKAGNFIWRYHDE